MKKNKREIKVRVWTGNKMLYFPNIVEWDLEDHEVFSSCKKLAVMQFLNSQDSLGKDMYEGDIVEYDNEMFGVNFLSKDVINSYEEMYAWKDSAETETWRVIGNIFENKKLVKKI